MLESRDSGKDTVNPRIKFVLERSKGFGLRTKQVVPLFLTAQPGKFWLGLVLPNMTPF